MLEVFHTTGVDNILVKTAPSLNQLLFQFIIAVDVCLRDTFLHDCPRLTVSWVETWLFRVQNPKPQQNKIRRLSTQQF